ncbi:MULTISPECIES: type II toxin-antitoxin system death-on-curing family toxin [Arthrobacter]|uniref:Type II toxin-antitoxin system death-on-curing family toxin n=2 Tax=Arthrobacter TaxID=1663 RepID=A0ABU9KNQ4_9MICC|nr:type II toxin-antitoxin system death-on-curing family toxin [Arthrobacter sp. YJM1]MDP5228546.1 type II toxin-antitoxin system death-on-curing family toxin [Arthrobacter sp. YJM1]
MEYLDDEDVLLIRKRLATSGLAGLDFGAERPLRPSLLASAVSRQTVGMGARKKYTTVAEVAATLFYGMALNHPFENGNKRTALVSMLVVLQKNRTLLIGTSEDELYEMATSVADHSFYIPPGQNRNSDSEVAGLANWLDGKTRDLTRGDRQMKFQELRAQLEEQGCEFGKPSRNFIKVYRDTPNGRFSAKMGYPRPQFPVAVKDVKRVRSLLKLDEVHGFDSDAFYSDVEGVADEFINKYRQVLDRLALT